MTRTGEPFEAGEPCLLNDARGRRYLVALAAGDTFHFDKGSVPHDTIIGAREGTTLRSDKGTALVALRPRLTDYILTMKRGAAVMYPKDIGPVLMWADIAPGCTVVEAGTGSGALALALTRAVGESGRVVSVERREDHAQHAARLISAFSGGIPANLELRAGTVEAVIPEIGPDRIVLDLPEPWEVVDIASTHLTPGGTLASYLPTVPQVQRLRETLDEARAFTEITTFEMMLRTWTVDGPSVRPDHRMVGHTGFITVARRRIRQTE